MLNDQSLESAPRESSPAKSSIPPADLNPDRRGFWKSLKDRLWGYDFFISYHWASGGIYAVNLAQRLREHNYDVFLDRADYASGDDWKAIGEIALRNTQRLVLIATREAVTISKPVEHEIAIFTARNRQVISIVFGDKFEDLDRSQYLTLNRMPESKLYIEDGKETLTSGPSEKIVAELTRTQGVMRRRNLRALLTLIAAMAVMGFAAFATVSWGNAVVSANKAIRSAKGEEQAKIATKNELARAQFALGRIPFEKQEFEDAALWWTRAQATSEDVPFRESMSRLVGASTPKELRLRHDGAIKVVEFSPSGQTVLTGSDDKTARLWDTRTGAPRGEPMNHEGTIWAVAFSQDGQKVLTGSKDKTARLWDACTGKPLGKPLPHGDQVLAVEFSSDNQTVLTRSIGTTAWLWDVRTSDLKSELKHNSQVWSMAFSPDGQTVITGSGQFLGKSGEAKFWDARTGEAWGKSLMHDGTVLAVTFSPDGQTVLTGSEDTTARLWDVGTRALLRELKHNSEVWTVAFSPDGQTVLTLSGAYHANITGEVRLWDAGTGVPRGEPRKHIGPANVGAVAFSADNRTVLTGSDQGVQFWDAETSESRGRPVKYDGPVNALAFSRNNQIVLAGSVDQTARLWDLCTVVPRGKPLKHTREVTAIAFSQDRQTALSGSQDGTARLCDVLTGEPKGATMNHAGPVDAAAFSPDGKTVLTASKNRVARLWDARTGEPRSDPLTPSRNEGSLISVTFSPDDPTILTNEFFTTAQLWHARTGEKRGGLLKHAGQIKSVAFSADGQKVVTGSDDNTARLWDACTGAPIGKPLPHGSAVAAVAFSPDGQTVLTRSHDSMARLWDARTGEPRGAPLIHKSSILAVAFSPDGQSVLTGSHDRTARLWDVGTGMPLGTPLEHSGIVQAVAFSLDGQTILTASGDEAQLWSAPAPAINDRQPPDRLLLSVEIRTGKWLDASGEIKRLTFDEWNARWKQLNTMGDPCDRPTWDEYNAWKMKPTPPTDARRGIDPWLLCSLLGIATLVIFIGPFGKRPG